MARLPLLIIFLMISGAFCNSINLSSEHASPAHLRGVVSRDEPSGDEPTDTEPSGDEPAETEPSGDAPADAETDTTSEPSNDEPADTETTSEPSNDEPAPTEEEPTSKPSNDEPAYPEAEPTSPPSSSNDNDPCNLDQVDPCVRRSSGYFSVKSNACVFIQCANTQAFCQNCGPGTQWSQRYLTCIHSRHC